MLILAGLLLAERGMPTRFEFDLEAARGFVDGSNVDPHHSLSTDDLLKSNDLTRQEPGDFGDEEAKDTLGRGNRVFITHGKNNEILEQVKTLVAYGEV